MGKALRSETLGVGDAAVDQRISSLGLSNVELAGIQLANPPRHFRDAVAPYPDTPAQYASVKKATAFGPASWEHIASEKARAEALAEAVAARQRAEAEANAASAESAANIDRMSKVLTRIAAMHNSGELEAPVF